MRSERWERGGISIDEVRPPVAGVPPNSRGAWGIDGVAAFAAVGETDSESSASEDEMSDGRQWYGDPAVTGILVTCDECGQRVTEMDPRSGWVWLRPCGHLSGATVRSTKSSDDRR